MGSILSQNEPSEKPGTIHVHATVAYAIFTKYLSRRWRSPERVMTAAMTEAASLAEHCSPPIEEMSVSATGVKKRH
jgi:hypothetical protein